jgi:hypothetical protein
MTNRGEEEYSARFVPVLSKSFLVSYFLEDNVGEYITKQLHVK